MTIQAFSQNEPHKKLTYLFFPSFTGCVAISGPITGSSLKIYMTYVAFEPADVNSVSLVRVLSIPFWITGTKCVTVNTGNTVRNIQWELESVLLRSVFGKGSFFVIANRTDHSTWSASFCSERCWQGLLKFLKLHNYVEDLLIWVYHPGLPNLVWHKSLEFPCHLLYSNMVCLRINFILSLLQQKASCNCNMIFRTTKLAPVYKPF